MAANDLLSIRCQRPFSQFDVIEEKNTKQTTILNFVFTPKMFLCLNLFALGRPRVFFFFLALLVAPLTEQALFPRQNFPRGKNCLGVFFPQEKIA